MSNDRRVIIDRFEEEHWVVLEIAAGTTITVPAAWVPDDAVEGDVLRVKRRQEGDSSSVRFIIDTEERKRRTERIRSKLDRLRERDG